MMAAKSTRNPFSPISSTPSTVSSGKLTSKPSFMPTTTNPKTTGGIKKPITSVLSRRLVHKLIVLGIDRTPRPLYSNLYSTIEEKQQTPLDFTTGQLPLTSSTTNILGVASSSMFLNRDRSVMAMSGQHSGHASVVIEPDDLEHIGLIVEEKIGDDDAPAQFCLPTLSSNEPRPREHEVLITLSETPTLILYDRPSVAVETNTPEAEEVEQDNFNYDYITTGKGKNRKVTNAEVQTITYVEKTRETWIPSHKTRNGECYMTTWLMYDTFQEMDDKEKSKFNPMINKGSEAVEIVGSQLTFSKDEILPVSTELMDALSLEEQVRVIASSEAFKDAATKMERALASNVYQSQQKMFKGLGRPDPCRLDVEFKYTLNHLWTFTCSAVKGRCVTALSWSRTNKNLLAVGYGKHYYEDQKTGVVCCWSLKNPFQPERVYHFDHPVTHMDFSQNHPNLLAISFHDGSVNVIDIVSKTKNVISASSRENAHFEPVWQVHWFHSTDYYMKLEQIITAGQDGRICRFRRTEDFTCFQLMKVSRVEGKVKGIDHGFRCKAHDIPISRHPGILVLTMHPADKAIYYVGTDEGYVHKCSTNYLHQHLDLFLAHLGPIYVIEFSPFCRKIFLTCGADWCVRVWAEGVAEPLITLTTTMETVPSAAWNPVNATVIASISGATVNMWDIRRKTFVPASTTYSPTNTRNTVLQFTDSGDNLLVGDADGSVHVFGLVNMPFSPHYQEQYLVSAIEKALVTRQEILTLLRKTGKPF